MPTVMCWALFQEDVAVSRTDKIPHPRGTPVPLGETDGEQASNCIECRLMNAVGRSETERGVEF